VRRRTKTSASSRLERPSKIAITASLLALLVSSGACSYRGNVPVELSVISYADASPAIEGTVTLCVSKRLRKRSWQEDPRFYTIHLGRKAALAVERLVKASIRNVRTDFSTNCGKRATSAWLDAEIDVADRTFDDYGDTVTRIALTLTLLDPSGRILWTHTGEGQVVEAPSPLKLDHHEAARDFGQALEIALQQTHAALSASEAVRRELDGNPAPSPSRPTTL
jgi:hypothetical protein